MIARRSLLLAAGAALASTRAGASPPKLADDGMYHFDWYLESFLDLAEDIQTATDKGKRLAVIWGQRGCVFCKRLAEEHFVTPAIADYVKANFEIVHLNLFGAREVTDLGGAKRGEQAMARLYAIRTTPTIQFFPESPEGLGAREPMRREVARMPGLLEPGPFLAMFKFVRQKGYEKGSFPEWLKAQG